MHPPTLKTKATRRRRWRRLMEGNVLHSKEVDIRLTGAQLKRCTTIPLLTPTQKYSLPQDIIITIVAQIFYSSLACESSSRQQKDQASHWLTAALNKLLQREELWFDLIVVVGWDDGSTINVLGLETGGLGRCWCCWRWLYKNRTSQQFIAASNGLWFFVCCVSCSF